VCGPSDEMLEDRAKLCQGVCQMLRHLLCHRGWSSNSALVQDMKGYLKTYTDDGYYNKVAVEWTAKYAVADAVRGAETKDGYYNTLEPAPVPWENISGTTYWSVQGHLELGWRQKNTIDDGDRLEYYEIEPFIRGLGSA